MDRSEFANRTFSTALIHFVECADDECRLCRHLDREARQAGIDETELRAWAFEEAYRHEKDAKRLLEERLEGAMCGGPPA